MEAPQPRELMTEALELLVNALHLLDEAEAPGDIGAYVDHARERLSRTLELTRMSESITKQAKAGPAVH
jgi:hypothetical protein